MTEYIERIAAKVAVYGRIKTQEAGGVIDDLNAIPAADVEPVVHARWIECGMTYEFSHYNCSHCGEKQKFVTKRCGTCGAHMDEGSNEIE